MINRKGFHDSGPHGERDYEDGGSFEPKSILPAICKHEDHLRSTAKNRWTLRTKLVNEFVATNNRKPMPSELTSILRIVNSEVK